MISERLRPQDVVAAPYPHVLADGVLGEQLCRQLLDELPPLEKITNGEPFENNKRFDFKAEAICKDPSVSSVWKAFVRQHTSQEFLDQVVSLFKAHILNEHPRLAGTLESLRAGMRGVDDNKPVDILLDAQIGINTPVVAPCSVRGPHLDRPYKLFAGLLYLRLDADDSTGGDLELLSVSKPWPFGGNYAVAPEAARVEKTVRYQKNRLVLFLNTARSFHAVTPREVTRHPRLFINLLGEMRTPLFEVGQVARPGR